MYDAESGKMNQLHGPTTQLDATFDIILGIMRLKQKLRDPKTWPEAQSMVTVEANTMNSTFVNLEGLADNSLLFTFKLLSADPAKTKANSKTNGMNTNGTNTNGKKINGKQKTQSKHNLRPKLTQKILGFFPDDQTAECPLFKAVNENTHKEKTLQLHLPENRIDSWLTAALILLTYREINLTIWYRVTTKQKEKGIAGLNWVQIREKTAPIQTTLSDEAREKCRLAFTEELARWAAIEQQAIRLGLQGNPTQGYVGFSAMMDPTKHCRLRAGDLGFRG